MDKQTQVDGAVGSDGGGSRSVGQGGGTGEWLPNVPAVAGWHWMAECDDGGNWYKPEPRHIVEGLEGRLWVVDLLNGDWELGQLDGVAWWTEPAFVPPDYPAPAEDDWFESPGPSNTEGTADQSDSTTTNTQTTLPPIITKSPFKEPPVPQTVNVEEEKSNV